MQGFAQTPALLQPSHGQGMLPVHSVPAPAMARLDPSSLPTAAPTRAPVATSAPRPNRPRRDVLRASPSLTRRTSSMRVPLRAIGRIVVVIAATATDTDPWNPLQSQS